MFKRLIPLLLLVIGTGCSTSTAAVQQPAPTILACTTTTYAGPSVTVTLTAQEQTPTETVALGEEVVLGKRTNPGSGIAALPQTTPGAFCKRGEDSDHWYLIAKRRGTFRMVSYFLGGGGNINSDILTAVVVVSS